MCDVGFPCSLTARRFPDETQALRGTADYFDPEGAAGRPAGTGAGPPPRVVETTIYRWKSKYGGMEIGEAAPLRKLEQENARLKQLLAEAELDTVRAQLYLRLEGAAKTCATATSPSAG